MMTESRPQVLIIAGPNGAGKSTLAPFLLRDVIGLVEYVNADTIAQGLSAFNAQSAAFEAGRIMLKRLHDLADERTNFAFESTLASRSYASWIKELKQCGYDFHLVFLWLRSPDLAIQRVGKRVRAGGHDVTEEVIRRRYVKGVRNFIKLYQALANTWVIYDNSKSGRPLLIARGGAGVAPAIFSEEGWRKFCEATR